MININQKDKNGTTALDFCLIKHDFEMFKYLFERGAKFSSYFDKDCIGWIDTENRRCNI